MAIWKSRVCRGFLGRFPVSFHPAPTARCFAMIPNQLERENQKGQKVGFGSKIGIQNGTLVNGNMDENLRSPGGLILTQYPGRLWASEIRSEWAGLLLRRSAVCSSCSGRGSPFAWPKSSRPRSMRCLRHSPPGTCENAAQCNLQVDKPRKRNRRINHWQSGGIWRGRIEAKQAKG